MQHGSLRQVFLSGFNKTGNVLEDNENTGDPVAFFQNKIRLFFNKNYRIFPWRETSKSYNILVSEIMLQQTQTFRVMGKYEAFIDAFPDFAALAGAQLNTVLSLWQGLGYNRRALSLKKTAEIVVSNFHGTLPDSYEELISLPGIGKATAGSILAFAFNKPIPFIETNIRRVYIHFFFNVSIGDG